MQRRGLAPWLRHARGGLPEPRLTLPFDDLGSGLVNTDGLGLPGIATFTRALATATTVGSDRRIIASIAANAARSYYHPNSGRYCGYLSEGSRVNRCLQSQNLGVTWTNSGTPTLSAAAKSCGDLVLDLLGDDSAAAVEGKLQTITFSGDGTKAISLFIAQGTSISSVVRLRDNTAAADRLLAAITWSSGVPVVTITTGALIRTSGPYLNGVYRVEVISTSVTAANTNSLQLLPATDAALSVTPTGDIYIGGVQAEDASWPSTYIPTAAGVITRNADVLSYAAANRLAVLGDYTFACEAVWRGATIGPNNQVVLGSDTLYSPFFTIYGPDVISFYSDSTAGGWVQVATPLAMKEAFSRYAGTKRTNSLQVAIAANGVAAAATPGAQGAEIGNIQVGCANGSSHLYGAVRNLRLWDVNITLEQLAGLTTQ